jgi:hypothetical protein
MVSQGTPEPIFYDLYLQYNDGKSNMLYAIPLLVRNIKVGTIYPNKVSITVIPAMVKNQRNTLVQLARIV